MAQLAATSSWVKKSKYDDWGFDRPDPNLVKVVIDLRPKRSQAKSNTPLATGSSRMSSFLNDRQKARTEEQKANYEKFRKDNQSPGSSSKEFHPFGNETGANRYFSGPIIDKNTLRWRETNYTRACGDVIGAKESGIPIPSNMSNIVKSVAVMSNEVMTQTAIWVGPRLLLSTLHFRPWIQNQPSHEECDLVRKMGETFNVESEICSQVLSGPQVSSGSQVLSSSQVSSGSQVLSSSQVLSEFSPKVQLVEFSAEHDIGLFKLQDHYPSRTEYLDPDWLMECDEAYRANLEVGRNVACVGYSSKISHEDATAVMKQVAIQLQIMSQSATQTDQINLDMVAKPSMKSFAPGTLDKIEARSNIVHFGVSSSLWKGSSGGPCILLDGTGAGTIIGLARGYELLSDPYNDVNGFPNGLKELIKSL